ncbi:MAG: DUF4349 domain-containing protein [Gemmataceae bacterium]
MSTHTWVQENMATYVTGGLEPDQAQQLQSHVAECQECADALEQIRTWDTHLLRVFGKTKPSADLDAKTIQGVNRSIFWRRTRAVAGMVGAMAAVFLLGVFGAFMVAELEGRDFWGGEDISDTMITKGALVPPQGPRSLFGSPRINDPTKFPSVDDLARDLNRQVALHLTPEEQRPDWHLVDGSSSMLVPPREGKSGSKEDIDPIIIKDMNPDYIEPDKEIDHQRAIQFDEFRSQGKTNKSWPDGFTSGLPPSGKVTLDQRIQFAPVFKSPKVLWAVPGHGESNGTRRYTGDGTEIPTPTSKRPPSNENGVVTDLSRDLPSNTNEGREAERLNLKADQKSDNRSDELTRLNTQLENIVKAQKQFDSRENDKIQGRLQTLQPPMPSGEQGKSSEAPPAGEKGIALSESLNDFRPSVLETTPDPKKAQKGGESNSSRTPPPVPEPNQNPQIKPTGAKTSRQVPKKEPKVIKRKIIRTGELEFEIESFDPAVDTVQKLAESMNGYVATVNSDKLANGKVRGSVVIRVPPEKTYDFVKGVRKALLANKGQLLGQRLGSKDITKQYTDIESRLRAARTMEERLIKIIKSGKGEIKDLLKAEQELGIWRTKIEQMEGEIRYYNNLVSLATITITLTEREIQTAAKVIIRRSVDARVIVDEVEKAREELEKEILKSGGRISQSELAEQGTDQRNAILRFSVPPKSAPDVERALKKLGTAVKFETKRSREIQGGPKDPKDQTGTEVDTEFSVVLYNLANVAPLETITVMLVVDDVEQTYRTIKNALTKAKARVLKSERNDDKSGVGALFSFDVKRSEEDGVRATFADKERLSTDTVKRAEKTEDVTDTKVRYLVWVYDLNSLQPRETVAIILAAEDVRKAHEELRDIVDTAKAKVHQASLDEKDRQNITGKLYFTIRRTEQVGLLAKVKTPTAVLTRTSERGEAGSTVTDSLVRYSIDLVNAANIQPRKTYVLGFQVEDVKATVEEFTKRVQDSKGRVADILQGKEQNGQTSIRVVYDVPLKTAQGLVNTFKQGHTVQLEKVSQNSEAPDQQLARGLIVVTVSDVTNITPRKTYVLGLQVEDVKTTVEAFTKRVQDSKGRVADIIQGNEKNGQTSIRVVYEVPLRAAEGLVSLFKDGRDVRVEKVSQDSKAPDHEFARAKISVTVSNVAPLVSKDNTFGASIRSGLSLSLKALSASLTYLIVALLVVLPWSVLLFPIALLLRWTFSSARKSNLVTETLNSDQTIPNQPNTQTPVATGPTTQEGETNEA